MIDKIIDDFKINFLINIYTQMQSYIAHALGLSTGIFPSELRILSPFYWTQYKNSQFLTY